MATTLPIPIEFSLPKGWRSVSPNEVGTPDVAFVALHPDPDTVHQGFTPNITISGEVRGEDVSMEQIADEAAENLRGTAREVKIGRRNEVGSADDPGLTQAVRISVELSGRARDLLQFQVFIGVRDQQDPNRRAVLHIALTSLPEQFEQIIGDFQKFVSTIKPETAG
jgi:hypothetical protein